MVTIHFPLWFNQTANLSLMEFVDASIKHNLPLFSS